MNKQSFPPDESGRKQIKFIIFFLILILSFVLIKIFNKHELVSPMASFSSETSLQQVVEKAMSQTKGRYGIVIKNFKTGESYFLNEHQPFDAGSLYKLWVMAKAFSNIQKGVWRKEQVLTEDVATLNDKFSIASDSAEQTEGTISFTVHDGLNQMITISHNYAALLLTEKLKLSNIAAFLKENNFNESKVGTKGEVPLTTPSDMALFFEKLYKTQLANQEYTNEMLDLLKRQELNDKLPKYLPAKTVVAHKTGEIGWFSHDVGIVFSEKGDYIIVVLSESDSPAGAEDRIAQISKAVYEYFNSNI